MSSPASSASAITPSSWFAWSPLIWSLTECQSKPPNMRQHQSSSVRRGSWTMKEQTVHSERFPQHVRKLPRNGWGWVAAQFRFCPSQLCVTNHKKRPCLCWQKRKRKKVLTREHAEHANCARWLRNKSTDIFQRTWSEYLFVFHQPGEAASVWNGLVSLHRMAFGMKVFWGMLQGGELKGGWKFSNKWWILPKFWLMGYF